MEEMPGDEQSYLAKLERRHDEQDARARRTMELQEEYNQLYRESCERQEQHNKDWAEAAVIELKLLAEIRDLLKPG